MRAVVIRTSGASLRVNGQDHARIGRGLVVLLGVTQTDGEKEATYLAEKCAGLRIFEDENGKLNLSLKDVGGQMLVVSNFTLYADCSHGSRSRCMNFSSRSCGGWRCLWKAVSLVPICRSTM